MNVYIRLYAAFGNLKIDGVHCNGGIKMNNNNIVYSQNSLSQKQKEKLKSSNYIFLKRHQYDMLFGHEKRSKATIVESEDELETSIRRIAELNENLQSRITSILNEPPDCYRQAEEEDEPDSLRHAKDGNSCQQRLLLISSHCNSIIFTIFIGRGKRLRRDLVMDENMESVRNASSDDIPILRHQNNKKNFVCRDNLDLNLDLSGLQSFAKERH